MHIKFTFCHILALGQAHGLQHMSSHVSITFYKIFHNVLDLVQTSPSFDCMFSSMCLHLTHWPLMGICLLLCAHDDERTRTHDVVCNMFTSIAWKISFHMGYEQLHVLHLINPNSFHWRFDMVFSKDRIYTLVHVIISNLTWSNLHL